MLHRIVDILIDEWLKQPGEVMAIVLRLLMALVLSAIIGWDRASKRHAAGLRTFILVGITSVFAAICDEFMVSKLEIKVTFLSAANLLCLSTISGKTLLFSSKNQLKGLTTSIALFTDAVLSICIGFGLYEYALIGFVTAIVCMALFPAIESRLKGISPQFEIHLELKSRNLLLDFIMAIREFGLHLDDIEYNPAYANTGLGVYTLKMTAHSHELQKKSHEEIIEALAALDCVAFVEELK
ncbi:MAG: MgtC/SapB family protein [Victivallales bacterium]|nr:MgtC/SapB family protein [Victivallales bacterium]